MLKNIIIILLLSVSINAASLGEISIGNLMGGSNVQNGDQPKKDSKKYKDLINFLTRSSNGEHTMYLAVIYLNGILTPDEDGDTVKIDIDKSIKFFIKSINLEYYQSSAILGSLYLYNDKFKNKKDSFKKAKYYLSLAIKKEVYEATVALSSIYFYEDNVNKGLEFLHIGAKNNISTAQLSLATLYGYGSKDLKIKQNKLIGNNFLEDACKNKTKTKKVKEFCSSQKVINKNEVDKK